MRTCGARLLLAAALAFGSLAGACGDGEPAATPAPTPEITPSPEPTPRTYVVEPGDTLTQIAERFGTTVDALVEANGIEDPDLIQPGRELRIP